MNSIPVIDLQNCTINQIHDACRDIGFFYLGNHGIQPALMKKILLLTQQFFAMPQDEKDKLSIYHSPYCRGYGKLMAEKTLGISDYKETYDLGLEATPHPDREAQNHLRLIGPNQWPVTTIPDFRETILSYLKQLVQLGNQLMQLITESLHLPASRYLDYFNSNNVDAFAMLRLLHYPASSTKASGVGEHVDAGFIALLLQDNTGGLQIQTRAKQWIDAPPLPDHFIVNIGEMLQSWSDHYYQATLHRVINHMNKCRVSVPFFFEPNLSTTIHPPGQPLQPVIYGDYMLKIFERSFPQNVL